MLQITKNMKSFLMNTHLHRLESSMAQTTQTCKAELRSLFFVVMSLKTKNKKSSDNKMKEELNAQKYTLS